MSPLLVFAICMAAAIVVGFLRSLELAQRGAASAPVPTPARVAPAPAPQRIGADPVFEQPKAA